MPFDAIDVAIALGTLWVLSGAVLSLTILPGREPVNLRWLPRGVAMCIDTSASLWPFFISLVAAAYLNTIARGFLAWLLSIGGFLGGLLAAAWWEERLKQSGREVLLQYALGLGLSPRLLAMDPSEMIADPSFPRSVNEVPPSPHEERFQRELRQAREQLAAPRKRPPV